MSGKAPAFQFYTGDWIQDTRILTLATRGIWIDMLCFMWRSPERGILKMSCEQFARLLSCTREEVKTAIAELAVTCNANVTESNGIVTIINRRMAREERERISTRCRVAKHRAVLLKQKCNASVTLPSSSSSSSSTKVLNIELSNDNSSPELNKKASGEIPQKINSEITIELPLNDGTLYPITADVIANTSELYPAVDIEQAFRNMKGWLLADPKRRKTKRGIKRFYTGWLSRAQDKFFLKGNANGRANVFINE